MCKNLVIVVSALMSLIAPGIPAATDLPATAQIETDPAEPACPDFNPQEWRQEQASDGVNIQASRLCNPDNPADIAAFVKGTNHISMDTLMNTQLAADAVTKWDDIDGDGDPDRIIIKLEVVELNGHSPDFAGLVTTFDIAPGIQPTFWVFAPKTRDMSTLSLYELQANPLLRLPSPVIRVEQGDIVHIVLENTHYLPHSLHLHGIDHPFMNHGGGANDDVGQTSGMDVMPGQSKTYVINPRQPGTQYYHCHVQPHTHIPMGLQGIFVVEENRPNNWVQTFNVGAGQVRHPSVAVSEQYVREYDLHYETADKELHEQVARSANDPRLIARNMNTGYDITEADDDYFMLNGRSFPYTLRESLIEMEPGKKVKLRVMNGGTETLALHLHGHKPTVTHYDGVDNGPGSYITRDVHGLTPAQRLDLELSGVDDGLHSFGEGVWMFHDHVEKAFTTDGVGEGGDISLVVYKNFITENGIPSVHGMSLASYFSKGFWQKKYPLWQDYDEWKSLGLPDPRSIYQTAKVAVMEPPQNSTSPESTSDLPSRLFSGFVAGLLLYLLWTRRQLVINRIRV